MFRILLALMFTTSAHAADLKVLSWNIFMLPKPVKNSLQKVRAKVISNQLKDSDYDLMFFQEAFTDSIRKELTKSLGKDFPHQHYMKRDGKIKHVFGSGLFVMSRYPFKVLDKVYYKNCKGADCYAAKGSFLIEATLPSGKVVQFAPTHLQSLESTGAMRLSQLEQLNSMLREHKKSDVPQIVLGDLNIDSVEPEFGPALKLMGMVPTPIVGPIQHTNGRINDCYGSPGKNKEWIDHFWVTDSLKSNRSTMQVRNLDFVYKGKICPTSDHHAIEAEIFLN